MEIFFKETDGLIEQHIHGGFGIDFNKADVNEMLEFSQKILKYGVTRFYPTLVSDTLKNLKKQIKVIKKAMAVQSELSAKISGVHLEGPFINPLKKGIHDKNLLQIPSIEAFQEIEDEIIKIVTLAPEKDEHSKLTKYLNSKGITVSAGHCTGDNLKNVNQVTHLFNAMTPIHHRNPSTALSALLNDEIYIEVIADLNHLSIDILKLIFKTKPQEKIILVSDALPLSQLCKKSIIFCSQEIFKSENCAKSKENTLAGSTMFLNQIIKQLAIKNILPFEKAVKMATQNICTHLKITQNSKVIWNENYEVVEVFIENKSVFRAE